MILQVARRLQTDARQTRVEVLEFNPEDPGLSCGESDFMALLLGGSIELGAKAMGEDFGQKFGIDLETDSSAAKGVPTSGGV